MDALAAVAELLAPSRCTTCGRRSPPPWCAACARRAITVAAADACGRCGLAGNEDADGHGCWPADAPVARSLAAFDYRGPVADAVVAGKAGGVGAVWPALGRRLGAAVVAADATAPLVVPVPTDARRRRQRGLDHTAVLAGAVAGVTGAEVLEALAAAPGRVDQGERPLELRRAVPLSAFRPRRRVPGGRVLLVDDVLTTGGTAWTAAAALRRAGAAEVVVAVVARAGRHPLGPDRAPP